MLNSSFRRLYENVPFFFYISECFDGSKTDKHFKAECKTSNSMKEETIATRNTSTSLSMHEKQFYLFLELTLIFS